ncbi:hypothetical protein CELL_01764 [Cellulomonas sp. T2.31MG-18]
MRVLALFGLLSMGLPVLWVISDLILGALVGALGGDADGRSVGVLAWVLAVVLFLPLAWLAFRTNLEGVALGRRAVRGWAESRGWSTGAVPELFEDRWESPPFATTRSQVLNLISRTDGRGTVFSMTYVIDDVPRHVVTTTRPFDGPPVRLVPRTLLRAAVDAVGAQEISTEWADFNSRWSILSADPRHALAMVHPRVMERLMTVDDPTLEVLFEAGDVVVHRPGRIALSRVSPMAQLVVDLAELVPVYVLDDNPPLPGGATRRQLRQMYRLRPEGWRP